MSGTPNTRSGNALRPAHLAVIEGAQALGAPKSFQVRQQRVDSAATSYAAHTTTVSAGDQARVRHVAVGASTFEAGLRSMVVASGVPESAADAVSEAILNNPKLRDQAAAAFFQIHEDARHG